ncbi:MAG TPA: metallopeptidase TldD-related protein [Candidatus Acidoferrales bacterium]|nr:metallopeptidase TldD-related protein [Candidatus Acidoferrales bacterium]
MITPIKNSVLAVTLAAGSLLLPACAIAQQNASTANDHTMQAMHDELERSRTRLQIPGQLKPFFIEYRLVDLDVRNVTASFGALVTTSTTHNRYMDVDIRVGDYKLDSSNFIAGEQFQGFLGSAGQVGVDGDYESLRQDLWLATDQAYKQALTTLAQKQGFLQSLARPPEVADFSQEKPVNQVDPRLVADWTNRNWEEEAKKASAALKNYPDLTSNRVTYTLIYQTYYLMDTEGTSIRVGRTLAAIEAGLDTQAPDGVPMHNFYATYTMLPGELPSADEVAKQLDARGKELVAERTADPVPSYAGPVLFENRAAAELLAQLFAPSVAGSRPPLSMLPMYDQIVQARGGRSEWLGRLNSRVLPTGTSLIDDPFAKDPQGHLLPGSHAIDAEGVAAEKITLVDNGILKDLAMSRRPGQDFAQSNGHARALFLGDALAMSTNLFLSSANGIAPADLKKKFLDECKQDGRQWCLMVRAMDNPGIAGFGEGDISELIAGAGNGERIPLEVYRIDVADGQEHLVIPGHFQGINLRMLRDVAAIGNDPATYAYEQSAQAGIQGTALAAFASSSDGVPSTITSPSLLFEDIEAREARGEMRKQPLVPPPPMK